MNILRLKKPKYKFPKPNNNGKLPFPHLPSLLLTATVLSYFEWRPEVEMLMKQLSTTCSKYIVDNSLKGFLREYEGAAKELQWIINFGPHEFGR